MNAFYAIFVALLDVSQGDYRRGEIINFEPPDLNDWVDAVLVRETDVPSQNKNGRLVTNAKLDLFSMTLERYCVETDDLPLISQSQWYHPQKLECKGERYNVMTLRYNNFDIDCLRVTSADKVEALQSVKAIVLRRFFLKVVYLTSSGDCYVKYFELPVNRCSRRDHVKLPADLCDQYFPLLSEFTFVEMPSSTAEDDGVNVKTVS